MKIEKQKKYLCLILAIITVLVSGLDISRAEAETHVHQMNHEKKEAVLHIPDSAWGNRDACTEDLLGIQEINSSIEQYSSTEEKTKDIIGTTQDILLEKSLLYSKMGTTHIHTSCLSSTVIIGYVHQKDGKKDSIIII